MSYLARGTEEKSRISLTFCVVGSHPAQIYLVIDCEVELYHSVFALCSGFFVFNVQHTTGCNALFSFLESLLNLQSKQTRQPSVALFMTSLT